MELQQLVDGDCGGANPLMQLGAQFSRDAAVQDEGVASARHSMTQDDQMVHDFFGQIAGPPQSFQMQTLLQEMREIEQRESSHTRMLSTPRIIDEVARLHSESWGEEYAHGTGTITERSQAPLMPQNMINVQPQRQETTRVIEFFDEAPATIVNTTRSCIAPCYPAIPPMYQSTDLTKDFFERNKATNVSSMTGHGETTADWINDYEEQKKRSEKANSHYNEKFWQRLQEEWQKLSEESEHPWLSEFSEQYDAYKEYKFVEENPMSELENALEKGREYLAKGDIPSAVLCFEVAVKRQPEDPEVWELLGLSQAENEMDPQSIAALQRSLDIEPNNMRVLMALAVCYTNEGLQSHALNMLTKWLGINPKYKHLVQEQPELQADTGSIASSLIQGNRLLQVQNLFLEAVRQHPQQIDADAQEALGVLYNLSSEYDKAADCFRVALHVNPGNAKVWNRLGASLANGSRSVEAVEAYKQALALEPGFIRVRYNVGVCCMNLKAYKQAAEHLLTALNMQANSAALRELSPEVLATAAASSSLARSKEQMSESIWNTLKMVISLMGHNELMAHLNERNLRALNEAFME